MAQNYILKTLDDITYMDKVIICSHHAHCYTCPLGKKDARGVKLCDTHAPIKLFIKVPLKTGDK